ncbi:2'-5'-oligoadenylate synthase 3-like [Lineus longissimus]|uniref:2'-5'-oligoadenylate synthase 3-like n=1 Tax=Lineus longissimus TaxID=88925 RepID=UPI00315CD57C
MPQRRSKADKEEKRSMFDDLLSDLVDDLEIDEEFKRRGKAAANRVFRLLQRESEYRIDRVKVAGGQGKNTSIRGRHMDYDCVVFINGEEPPFSDVIDEFEALINNFFEIPVSVTPYSLKFKLDDVNFDLLPATNEVLTHDTSDTTRMQVARTLDKMKRIPAGEIRYYSAALTEGALDFIQSRSDFVLSFIKLCKYWNNGVKCGYISGRSTIIETIAVAVAEEEETKAGQSRRKPSLRNSITNFLEQMRHTAEINVAFYHNYRRSDVPRHIAKQRPLVLDPSNPWNNLLSRRTQSSLEPFEEHAKNILGEIYKLNAVAYQRDLEYTDISALFRPYIRLIGLIGLLMDVVHACRRLLYRPA